MRIGNRLQFWSCVLVSVVSLVASECAFATLAGTDDASQNPPYGGSWDSGDDGATTGDAFGSWSLNAATSGGGFAGHFIGNSTNLAGGSGADINVGGFSFGMFGTDTRFADAFRSLNGALSVGQVLSLDIAVNFRNGDKGFNLRDSSNSTLFNFNVGSDDYRVNNATTNSGSIGNAYSEDTEFHLTFEQTSTSEGTWTVIRSGGVADLDTGLYSGIPTNLQLYINSTGSGSANDLYANNLSVVAVPEPSAFLFGGLICSVLGVNYARRRHFAKTAA